jgi:hypothetical protein
MSETKIEYGLTQQQKDEMLSDIHGCLVGNPLAEPPRLGLVVQVERHKYTLYGNSGKNGLVGDNNRFKKLVWVGSGVLIVLQLFFAWLLAMKTAGK